MALIIAGSAGPHYGARRALTTTHNGTQDERRCCSRVSGLKHCLLNTLRTRHKYRNIWALNEITKSLQNNRSQSAKVLLKPLYLFGFDVPKRITMFSITNINGAHYLSRYLDDTKRARQIYTNKLAFSHSKWKTRIL